MPPFFFFFFNIFFWEGGGGAGSLRARTTPANCRMEPHIGAGGRLAMNRMERRAALKHDKRLIVPAPASAPPREIDELAAEARRHFDLRDFAAAEKLCKDILSRAPSHVDSINLLGLMAQESARHCEGRPVLQEGNHRRSLQRRLPLQYRLVVRGPQRPGQGGRAFQGGDRSRIEQERCRPTRHAGRGGRCLP